MLCDGDSKSYDAVSVSQIYGPQHVIEKEDCINHISKRRGNALRKLVETSKAQGNSISGQGKLTNKMMAKSLCQFLTDFLMRHS